MKYFFLTALLILSFASAYADDMGFESTKEGIIKKLTEKPRVKLNTRAGEKIKTRAIRRVSGDGKSKTLETVDIPETDIPKLVPVAPIGIGEKPENKEVKKLRDNDRKVNLKIYFVKNSAEISPESKKVLDELGFALIAKELLKTNININGHTDTDGSPEFNANLSYERALAVKKYLIDKHKINPDRLKAYGYGEELPLFDENSDVNKALNRRVEIENMDKQKIYAVTPF